MRAIPTLLIHHSGIMAEGLRRILPPTRFRLSWSTHAAVAPGTWLHNVRGGTALCILEADDPAAAEDAVAAVRSLDPDVRIVATGISETAALAALLAGASGYLRPTLEPAAFVTSLDLIVAGAAVVPRGLVARLLGSVDADARVVCARERSAPHSSRPLASEPLHVAHGPAQGAHRPAPPVAGGSTLWKASLPRPGQAEPPRLDGLEFSSRDLAILRGLSVGATNKEIAREADLPLAVVKTRLKSIVRRIGARNRTHAAVWAQERFRD